MNNLIQFNNQNLKIINHNDQLWLTSVDVAKALNYSDSNAITLLYSKHKAEFDEDMSQTIETIGSGNLLRKQRIFSREGAWLIGMFARTPKAAEFRKWVLKVLGAVADNQVSPVPSLTQDKSALKAIGGIVKKCVNKAMSDFLSAELPASDDVLRQKYYNVTDKDMAETLQRWYWSRNYDVRKIIDSQNQRIEELETKLRMVQKVVC